MAFASNRTKLEGLPTNRFCALKVGEVGSRSIFTLEVFAGVMSLAEVVGL